MTDLEKKWAEIDRQLAEKWAEIDKRLDEVWEETRTDVKRRLKENG